MGGHRGFDNDRQTLMKIMNPREGKEQEEKVRRARKEKDGKKETSQDEVCVLEMLRLDDCLEMVTRETP